MHAVLLAVLLAAPARFSRAFDQPGHSGYGLGLMLGEPTGVSLKRYLPGGGGWDAYVGFAYGPGVRFGGDWLWTLGNLAHNQDVSFDAYAGAGLLLGTFSGPCGGGFINNSCNGDLYFGGRVPIGVEAIFRRAPVSIGLEIAPGFGIVPPSRSGLLLDLLFAIRFLF